MSQHEFDRVEKMATLEAGHGLERYLDHGSRIMNCVDDFASVNERLARVLTQYRESPKLLHVIRTYLRQVEMIQQAVCDLPSAFDIETAVGDQLTLLGRRLGFPRLHCVCVVQPVFGFDCGRGDTTVPTFGFCGGARAGALKWKWAAAAKRGDYAEAARLLKTTGTTAKGKRLQGLVNRRLDEGELINLADYTIGRPRVEQKKPAAAVLRRGERGSAVTALQNDLLKLGYQPGKADGIFGYGTEAAVLEFQRKAKLKADGIAGPQTLSAIDTALKGA